MGVVPARDRRHVRDRHGACPSSFRLARSALLTALAGAGLPYGVTVHDFHLACPTITLMDATDRFCGGETDPAACTRCLSAQPGLARYLDRRLAAVARRFPEWCAIPDRAVEVGRRPACALLPPARRPRRAARQAAVAATAGTTSRLNSRCPMTGFRWSESSARSVRSRARATSKNWSSSRARGSCRCAWC